MTASPARAPSAYLPDVEGLRGVAILLVVLYHAGLSAVSGGYVGVDVFFVLSGYLIIGQLAREIESTGRIDLTAFYARRARRLLPAAAVVILATLLASIWLLPPRALEQTADAGIASAFYVSNLFFGLRATDYLADESANPLLHTWSLSVEEQFYIAWPLALTVVALVFRGISPRTRVLWLTCTFIAASFAWAAVQQPLDASWAFLSPLTRAWEFGLGGLVALFVSRSAPVSRGSIVAGYAGAAGIVAAALAFGDRTSMPSWPALLPTVGTALVLAGARQNGQWGVGRLLTVGPLRWVGRVSYAWYLWHWPVGVLAQFYLQRDSVWVNLAAAACSLALAEVTRRLIEDPIRFHPTLTGRSSYALRLAAGVVILTGVTALGAQTWATHAATLPRHSRTAQAEARPAIYDNGCFLRLAEVESPPCESGDTLSSRTVVLFGDSHAAQWYPALERVALERGLKLVALTKASCPIAWTQGSWSRAREDACLRWRASAMDRILETRPFLVITSNYAGEVRLAGTDGGRYDATAWRDGLRRSLHMLDSAGITTVLLRDTPRPGFDVPTCVAMLERWQRSTQPFCAFERSSPRAQAVAQLESEAADGLARVTLLDLTQEICPEATCWPTRDEQLVWRDRHHLTAGFSARLGDTLARSLAPVLRRLPALASS